MRGADLARFKHNGYRRSHPDLRRVLAHTGGGGDPQALELRGVTLMIGQWCARVLAHKNFQEPTNGSVQSGKTVTKKTSIPKTSRQRLEQLSARRNMKMARSAHAYVRGSTTRFYQWLNETSVSALPQGPAIWICGDCHTGNLGPVANTEGDVEVQIRDLDQTVIGNPVHDVIRLALSLATAARGSDLPGVTTLRMMESLIYGYASAIKS